MAVDLPPAAKSFVDVPYVVQAAGQSALGLAERAANALAKLGKPGATVSFGQAAGFQSRGPSTTQGQVPQSSSGTSSQGAFQSASPGRLDVQVTPAAYHAMILGIQAKLDRELPKVEGSHIAVFDSSASDYKAEVQRTIGTRKAFGAFGKEYRAMGGMGGFATPYSTSPDSGICLVVGLRPDATLAGGTHTLPGVVPKTGAATNAEFHLFSNWHEVGHCLLGASEMRADTFGALISIQQGVSRDLISTVSNMREIDETVKGKILDNHATSQGIAWVARHYSEIKADPEFAKLDVRGVAAMAAEVADRFDLSPEAMRDEGRLRLADAAFFQKAVHWDVTPEGMRPLNHHDYLAAHAAEVPFLGRLADLKSRIVDMTIPPSEFRVDVPALREQLGRLAAKGDPTAAAMAEALDAPLPMKAFAPGQMPLAYEIADDSPVADRFFAMDTASVKVSFTKDQSAFAAKDPETGHVVMANVKTGETREFFKEVAHAPVGFGR